MPDSEALDCSNLRLWTRLTDIAVASIGRPEGDFEPYRRMALTLIDAYLADPCPCQCDECERSGDDGELRHLRAYLRGSAYARPRPRTASEAPSGSRKGKS